MPLRPIRVKKSKIRNADLAEVLTPRENKENQPENEEMKTEKDKEKEEQE